MADTSGLSRVARWLERDHPLWVCLLPGLALLPFVAKAFHIDDTQFLIYARLISQHPFDPFEQVFEWDSMRVAIIDFPHPLAWQYALAGVRALFGESEVAMHTLTFCAGLLALAGTRGLAMRLGVSALPACVLLSGSSAFLVMGSSIMPDLAAMALSIAALERAVAAVEDDDPTSAVVAGLLAAAAFGTRFTSAIVVGLLVLYPVVRRRRALSAWLPAFVAVALVVASELWSFASAGRPHFLSTLLRWSNPPSWSRDLHFAFNEITFLGAQLPITGLTWLALGSRDARARLVLALSGVAAVVWAWGIEGEGERMGLALIFAWPSLLLVIAAGLDLLRGIGTRFAAADPREAIRWMLAVLLIAGTFATFRYEHVAVKYLLLPLPAAILWLLDGLSGLRGRLRPFAMALLLISCVVAPATGLAVALSDFRWANTYRDFIADTYPSPPRVPTYYNAQWGLRFYAERAGLRPYRGGALEPGARLLISEKVPPNWEVSQLPGGIVGVHELAYSGPFALLDFAKGAGFYSNFWGDKPFALARTVQDRILILAEPVRGPSSGP